jgi:hypothetical protein
LSAKVVQFPQGVPQPVSLEELRASTQNWMQLMEIENDLMRQFKRLKKLKKEAARQRESLAARMAAGANFVG